MSSAQHNAAQTHGQAQAKKEDWVQSAQNTAKKACDKTADNPEQAQRGKEQSAGFLQQTGEQVMNMAQGAIDGVKNTLGVNNEKSTHGHEVNNEKSTYGHGHGHGHEVNNEKSMHGHGHGVNNKKSTHGHGH